MLASLGKQYTDKEVIDDGAPRCDSNIRPIDLKPNILLLGQLNICAFLIFRSMITIHSYTSICKTKIVALLHHFRTNNTYVHVNFVVHVESVTSFISS